MLTLQRPTTSTTSIPTITSSDLEAAETPPSLIFDRRIGPRRPAAGGALASVAAGADGEGVRLVPLQLIDSGAAGIGAVSASRLRPGMRVTLHSVDACLARDCGIVARCDERADGGYLVGIAFDSRMAA